VTNWEGLNPPYGTLVVDPPWKVPQAASNWGTASRDSVNASVPYSTMSLAEIAALPVADLAADYAHLYLWSVNRFMAQSFDIVRGWGFGRPTVLTWCKQPKGVGPGREYASTTEFVLFARRGSNPERGKRQDSSWWLWPRRAHSEKPQEFFDMVPTVSPGPYVELFARAKRPGWDGWGNEYGIGDEQEDLFGEIA
jgi:N6-adenosine-specific RNA methylase IME4